ncbi:amp dependent CoA ligase [Abortiporus biennis]|nr:amp dependent CoA ligase [Abortiporus biennis]
MSEIYPLQGPIPHVPDDLTLPQFILDTRHPQRPLNTFLNPWFIEEATGRQIGFEEVRARTFGLANELKARWNIGENDIVCIFSPNHVDYPIATWAIHRLGAIVTTANPAYTSEELTHQINLVKTKHIITHSTSLAVVEASAKETGIPLSNIIVIDLDYKGNAYSTVDSLIKAGLSKEPTFVERRLNPGEAKTKLAFLICSSGTTGKPKAVAIPHIAPIANVIQMAFYARVTEDYTSYEDRRYRVGDVTYAVLPFYHIYGLVVNLHFYLFCGHTLVISSKFNFTGMLKSIERYHINHMLLVPPMIVLLCKNPEVKNYNLKSLRFIMCGAAPLSAELTNQAVKILPDVGISQGYGMTETSTTVTFPRIDQKIGTPGSAGELLPGCIARVVKEDGSLAKFGEKGELWVKTPSSALRYLNNDEATKETFVDGWVRTGDEVIMNERREVFVVDRMKEILKVKGFQVAPAELEGHLLEHPEVSDTCVVGIPDEYSGEVPLAFVVPSQNALERIKRDPSESEKVKASIMKHVSDHKVHYKRLAGGVVFLDVIPKNPSGKLLRRVLREKAKQLKAVPPKAKL